MTEPLLVAPTWGTLVLLCLASYLVGSIPFGLVVGKCVAGVDLRRTGSGNIGAANAFRTLGPALGVSVLVLDFAKGLLPVLLTGFIFRAPLADGPSQASAAVLVGILAIIGHNNSLYLGFKGGKGIATTFGVLTGLSLHVALIASAVWLACIVVTRFASVASLCAALAIPATFLWAGAPWPYTVFGTVACMLAFYRHRKNLGNLLRGEELPMFGPGSKKDESKD